MANKEINVIIEAILKDDQFKKGVSSLNKEMGKTQNIFKTGWSNITTGFNQGFELIRKGFEGIKKLFDMSKEFAKYQQGYDVLQRNTSGNAQKMIDSLKEVSANTISNKDLVLAANRAMALGVTDSTDTMTKLLEIARMKARQMGIDTTSAFDSMVTGIGRGSPMILDNLGIITKGWEEEAKAKGVSYDKQFILNKILAQGSNELSKMGGLQKTNAEKIQSFEVAIENFGLVLSKFADRYLSPVIGKISDFLVELEKVATAMDKYGTNISDYDKKMMQTGESYKYATDAVKLANKGIYAQIELSEKYDKLLSSLNDALRAHNPLQKEYYNIIKRINETSRDKNVLDEKIGKNIKALGYETITTAGAFKKSYEALVLDTVETNKNADAKKLNADTTNKLTVDKKAVLADYYSFIKENMDIELAKEQELYQKSYDGLLNLLNNGYIARAEYNVMLEELNAQHELNKATIEDEYRSQKEIKEELAMNMYGRTLEELTAKEKVELANRAKNYKTLNEEIETGMKTVTNKIVNDYSEGLATMMVEGDIFRKSFKDFISDIIKEVAKLIVKLTIAAALKSTLSSIGLGFLFHKGGEVPEGRTSYAATGMEAKGSDTVPAMLTPGERVLRVDQNKTFTDFLQTLRGGVDMPYIPAAVASGAITNNTSNNSATNNFYVTIPGGNGDDILSMAKRMGANVFQR